jgi:hypothetical protein
MKTVIDGFEAAGRGDIKMAVGGAPISQMFADEIGADGYGANASAAVDLFLHLARGEAAPAAVAESPAAPAEAGDGATREGKHSRYKVLFWQEIPSQVRVEDDAGNDVTVEMPASFAARIDAMAQRRGLANSDAYLAEWKWSDESEREGSAHAVAAAVKAELESKADW